MKESKKYSKSLYKDLSGPSSTNFAPLVEQLCDDLLEDADTKIDQIKLKPEQSSATPNGAEAFSQGVDNSYNAFIPCLKKKEHFIDTPELAMEIQKA